MRAPVAVSVTAFIVLNCVKAEASPPSSSSSLTTIFPPGGYALRALEPIGDSRRPGGFVRSFVRSFVGRPLVAIGDRNLSLEPRPDPNVRRDVDDLVSRPLQKCKNRPH